MIITVGIEPTICGKKGRSATYCHHRHYHLCCKYTPFPSPNKQKQKKVSLWMQKI